MIIWKLLPSPAISLSPSPYHYHHHQLGRLVSESACERKDPGSNPAADMVDAARNTAWDLGTGREREQEPGRKERRALKSKYRCEARWPCCHLSTLPDTPSSVPAFHYTWYPHYAVTWINVRGCIT
ncbi:hypothetical protein FHG87_003872 [Trinorchestia longiramus]|nr:hypothetical protein FHG87_003872 [Trinorchestia longiramus]